MPRNLRRPSAFGIEGPIGTRRRRGSLNSRPGHWPCARKTHASAPSGCPGGTHHAPSQADQPHRLAPEASSGASRTAGRFADIWI